MNHSGYPNYETCSSCGMRVWHEDQSRCACCGALLFHTTDEEYAMTEPTRLAHYCLDLMLEPGGDEDAANEALDELQLADELRKHAARLLAQHGGPLAGVTIKSRFDE